MDLREDARRWESADDIRSQMASGSCEPPVFRAALLRVPPSERDAWVDRVLGLGELPDDDPDLPKGCVSYLPCSVDALLRVVEHVQIGPSDVFVDIGSGVGRALAFVHLITGAEAIGVEIQPRLITASRELIARLGAPRLSVVEGDAATIAEPLATGSVFFLYCPFSGQRLTRVLDALASIGRSRTIRICSVDLPLPPRDWLELETSLGSEVVIYRSIDVTEH